MNDERFVKRQELAERFQISFETIRRWSRRGILKPVRIGPKAIRFRESDIERLIRQSAK
jgi:excisionase family DNA binding protein